MSSRRTLVIVESPTKAKALSSFLPKNYVVMASKGHISHIADGGRYWNTGIDPKNGFEADYEVDADKADTVRKLAEQARLADKVVLCSDDDREGEAIAWSLVRFLKLPEGKYERCTYHEVTEKAVKEALKHPRGIDADLVHAAHARQKLDKMMGYRLSPMARKAVGARSVGRCQSAGLELICARERQIREFVPEEYGELRMAFEKNGTGFSAKWAPRSKRKPTYDECAKAMAACEGKPAAVVGVKSREKRSNPKPPFTTSSYQQEASSKLGMSVKRAMDCAQRLFEGVDAGGRHVGLITYHRTDSAEFAPEFLPLLEGHVRSAYGDAYYAPVRKAKKQENAQNGHEAMRPVDLSMTPDKATALLKDPWLAKAYALIYNRTVASAMAPSRTAETSYSIECGGERFECSSKELLFDGYLRAYSYDSESKGSKETLSEGEAIPQYVLKAEKKQTQPPARYKEATFVKELEDTGIGRPSTYASIVSTLLDPSRGYCVEKDRCIVPTERGMALSEYLEGNFPTLIDVGYTGRMEEFLDGIAEGRNDEATFLMLFHSDLESACSKAAPSPKPKPAEGVSCPECGSPMVLRHGRYGDFYGCSRFPKCKGALNIGKDKGKEGSKHGIRKSIG